MKVRPVTENPCKIEDAFQDIFFYIRSGIDFYQKRLIFLAT